MTSQGHVTTESLKQANEEGNGGSFFISLHLTKLYAFNLETSRSELMNPKQYDVKV